MMFVNRLRILCTALLVLLVSVFYASSSYAAKDYQEAQPALMSQPMDMITMRGETIPFEIEVAVSSEEKERGLMFRKSLDHDKGMIFIFGEDHAPFLWMKNTFIPLDMVFLDEDGYILHIHHNATPQSLEPIGTGKEAWAVVELQGGICEKLGIAAGDRMIGSRRTLF